jgi:hypothetical protein
VIDMGNDREVAQTRLGNSHCPKDMRRNA